MTSWRIGLHTRSLRLAGHLAFETRDLAFTVWGCALAQRHPSNNFVLTGLNFETRIRVTRARNLLVTGFTSTGPNKDGKMHYVKACCLRCYLLFVLVSFSFSGCFFAFLLSWFLLCFLAWPFSCLIFLLLFFLLDVFFLFSFCVLFLVVAASWTTVAPKKHGSQKLEDQRSAGFCAQPTSQTEPSQAKPQQHRADASQAKPNPSQTQAKPSQSQSQASTSKGDQGTRDRGTRGPGDPGTRDQKNQWPPDLPRPPRPRQDPLRTSANKKKNRDVCETPRAPNANPQTPEFEV